MLTNKERVNRPMSQLRTLGRQLAQRIVLGFDTIQRHRHRVFEFDDDPDCILRISHVKSPVDRVLADGTTVRKGDPLIEIHYWNERIPAMRADGIDMTWGMRFHRCVLHSHVLLANYLHARPDCRDVVALYIESSFVDWWRYEKFLTALGYEYHRLSAGSFSQRMAWRFIRLYVWSIAWVLNPASLRGRTVGNTGRGEAWMSRSVLMQRYGAGAARRWAARERRRQSSSDRTTAVAAHRSEDERGQPGHPPAKDDETAVSATAYID